MYQFLGPLNGKKDRTDKKRLKWVRGLIPYHNQWATTDF
uniref:Uncharacterized protein n=1 Tax=Lepeophtheirus salmonis TaxID=72036 RepID=A0A0K2UNP6_LEPSM